ncbi:uncharacterized protein C8Q71DRAFT_727638 [Rhodofomes roseus]|uniref:NADAR domain-containing protein n=1 Tax=Rhodofomes roseus TaxID=34475 RepID=A0ABQ8K0D8_9APHY|nr:uncharacterized protein C8Q71DRAFT_727638 [Rhodofomes roseus]KAH9830119.1 hypothetical protein C8Q71DRAFT_727638 [Rhodofomes roseus]
MIIKPEGPRTFRILLTEERSHVIRFYHSDQPYYQFTNFAPYAIHWDGRMYPTAEHLFQAHKFMPNRPDLAERIRFLPDSRFALDEARNLRAAQRSDWFDINVSVMDDVLEAKFAQHLSLRDTLLSTSDNELIEDSPVDSFWGCGQDGLGKNELGKALMRLREKLRAHPARRHFAWTSPPPDRERRSEGVQPVPENSHGMTHAQLLPAPVKDQGTSQWHSPEWWGYWSDVLNYAQDAIHAANASTLRLDNACLYSLSVHTPSTTPSEERVLLITGIVLPDRSRHRATGRSPPAVPDPGQTSRILFYHRDEPYYEFTNFAPYAINWDGHTYPTAEHLFQAHKFMSTRADLAERIRRLHSSRAALEEAGRLRRLQRTDWFDVNIGVMDAVLEAKFTQHLKLRDLLLSTGHRELVEDSPVDSFWGWGNDCKGRNELGKALMRLRDKLRSTP